jgi:hypothetical protein
LTRADAIVVAAGMGLEAALSALPIDESRAAILADAAALRAHLGDSKALHDALKKLGVSKIGLRQKVALALEETKESALASRMRDLLQARGGLEVHADALCAEAERLVALATNAPKELHDALRACGVKALGQRQQVVLALQPLLPSKAAVAAPPPATASSRRVTSAASAASSVAAPPVDDADDDGLALEGNDDDELALEGNDDDGLALEGNDDDELALEGNDDDDGLALEGNDDDGLALEENDDDGLALEENAGRGGGEAEDDGFLLVEPNDYGAGGVSAAAGAGHGAYAGDMRLELVEPPWLPKSESNPFAKAAEDPVEGALIAGINGSVCRPSPFPHRAAVARTHAPRRGTQRCQQRRQQRREPAILSPALTCRDVLPHSLPCRWGCSATCSLTSSSH